MTMNNVDLDGKERSNIYRKIKQTSFMAEI